MFPFFSFVISLLENVMICKKYILCHCKNTVVYWRRTVKKNMFAINLFILSALVFFFKLQKNASTAFLEKK